MDFNLSDESKMLKNNAEKFMKEKSPGSFVKNTLKEEKGFSEALWKEMADLGWLGLIHAERWMCFRVWPSCLGTWVGQI